MRLIKSALTLIFAIIISQFSITPTFAAPDDGYPAGSAAPGRTCPQTPVGEKTVSSYSGKTLVCTNIQGSKKWWIENEPIPSAPTTPQVENSTPPVIPHTYSLPEKSLVKMKVIKNIPYATISATQKLDIYLPKDVKNPPLVIWLHGGGFMFLDKSVVIFDEGAKMLEALTSNGIGVAAIDYRLATEAKFPAAAQDTKSAIRFLRANSDKYGFDSKKLAVLGESSGAYLAVMAGISGNQKSVFDDTSDKNLATSAALSAVIEISGNANYRTMASNIAKYPCKANVGKKIQAMDNPWFGSESTPGVAEKIDSANLYPLLKTNKNLPSFFIVHGTEDCFVSPRDSIELDKTIKSLGGKSTLSLIKGGTHGGKTVWDAAIKLAPTLKEFFSKVK